MGGKGSGRLPSVETLVKRNTEQRTPIGTGLFLPNHSGIESHPHYGIWMKNTDGSIYYNSGNVGIGTATPATPLYIQTALTNTSIYLKTTATNGNASINYANDASLWQTGIYGDDSDKYKIINVTTDMFEIDTSGNTTTAGTATATKMLVTGDNNTNDSEYVPMVLHGTDATPPAASGFPQGTIYIQYTA